ncbi:hypothetical protein P9E76_15560 [Schinkia azotoformans]|uniref:Uncharacterized protein n=1 Tax=Schinkia azotoformans LMG 9581 TaxID=1131731 RepID=K6CAF2_SCHAZ|nr:hypothetical protein [Schinkia azotoformans]EKN68090.1 hypothetical protein BAZO_06219 [Schinkia azotoformans LMG 9581]MEC1638105.1 hypothetical protein [Schinkia azotoformans]MEC1946461.1 hypothetical protein [Schinkia azotoformans]
MILTHKIQTVGTIGEFMSGEYRVQRTVNKVNKRLVKLGIKVLVTVVAGSFMLDISLPMAFAQEITQEAIPVNAMTDSFGITVNKALQPLIDVLKELARPIAGVMVTAGCLRYMIGQQEQGIDMIQKAAIGYILVMLSPMILNIITGVGNSIA